MVDTLQNSIPNAIVLLKVKASHAAIKYAVANKDGSFKIVFNKNDLDSIVLEINAVGFITLQETIKNRNLIHKFNLLKLQGDRVYFFIALIRPRRK